MPDWTVWLSSMFIGWCRAASSQRPEAFDNYEKAIQEVRLIATVYSRNKIETCALGFKISVPNENIELRIAIDGEKHKMYIVGPV